MPWTDPGPIMVAERGQISFRGKTLGVLDASGMTINNSRQFFPFRRQEKMRAYDSYLMGVTTTFSFTLLQWNFISLTASLGAMTREGSVDVAYEDTTVKQSETSAYGDFAVRWENEGITYRIIAPRVLFGSQTTTLTFSKGSAVGLPCVCEVLSNADGDGLDWYVETADLPQYSNTYEA